jgi:hypothetical protein
MDECPRYGSPDRRSGRDPPREPAPAERAARTDSGTASTVRRGSRPGARMARAFAESPSGPRWTVARTARGHRSTGRQPRPSRTWRLDRSCLDVSPWLPWRSSWPRSRSPPRRRARAPRRPRPQSTPPRYAARSSCREVWSAGSCASTPGRPTRRSTGWPWGRSSRLAAEGRSRRSRPSAGVGRVVRGHAAAAPGEVLAACRGVERSGGARAPAARRPMRSGREGFCAVADPRRLRRGSARRDSSFPGPCQAPETQRGPIP